MNHLSLFLNTRIEDTGFFAWVGDAGLTPYRYLFKGQTVRFGKYNHSCIHHIDSFHKQGHLNFSDNDYSLKSSSKSMLKTIAAIALLIPGVLLSVVKVFSYIYERTRDDHRALKSFLTAERLNPPDDPYKAAQITLYKKNNTPFQATLIKTVNSWGRIFFTAYATFNNKEVELGHIGFDWLRRLPNGNYGSDFSCYIIDGSSIHEYGLETLTPKVNKIWVHHITSLYQGSYKGVGTALMQAAIEYGYSKYCIGRIDLSAAWASHGFYYKLGMRTTIPAINEAIRIQGRTTDGFGQYEMYMPAQARLDWMQKIKSNPIFAETLNQRIL